MKLWQRIYLDDSPNSSKSTSTCPPEKPQKVTMSVRISTPTEQVRAYGRVEKFQMMVQKNNALYNWKTNSDWTLLSITSKEAQYSHIRHNLLKIKNIIFYFAYRFFMFIFANNRQTKQTMRKDVAVLMVLWVMCIPYATFICASATPNKLDTLTSSAGAKTSCRLSRQTIGMTKITFCCNCNLPMPIHYEATSASP